ncbi:MAG: DUF3524 domain-containing protein, partial [Bacteroidota bacterium]
FFSHHKSTLIPKISFHCPIKMKPYMQILILCPFFTDSHAQWAKSYQQYSRHEVTIFSLPGRHWKWRMHGAAVTFAQQFTQLTRLPDVILATDMLDLTTFQSLTKRQTAHIPTFLYFHENQLTYPWSPDDQDLIQKRDRHYAWINYVSALSADQLWFNSVYHQQAFLHALPEFLTAFPDHPHVGMVDTLQVKSQVLPVGIDLHTWNKSQVKAGKTPTLLWNHRWEYDKGPEAFFRVLMELKNEKVPFQLIVLGKAFGKVPPIFAQAKEVLADRIIKWGYVEDRTEYRSWLQQADILPVTAIHEYQGIATIEAIHAGCIPLLPHRLSYPELIPEAWHRHYLYQGEAELKTILRTYLQAPSLPKPSLDMSRFDVRIMSPQYDAVVEGIV